jgi:hypothetical protein
MPSLSDGPPPQLIEICEGLSEATSRSDQLGFEVRGRRFACFSMIIIAMAGCSSLQGGAR